MRIAACWKTHPPASFSFLPEALEFCAFVARRGARSVYLPEVLACERATLELERARVGPVPSQTVRFLHDPAELLGTSAAGRRPCCIALRPCTLPGEKAAGEPIRGRVATIEPRCTTFEHHDLREAPR